MPTTRRRRKLLTRAPNPFASTERESACRSRPGLFGQGGPGEYDIETAIRLCRVCPLARGCLAYALTHPSYTEHGFRGRDHSADAPRAAHEPRRAAG